MINERMKWEALTTLAQLIAEKYLEPGKYIALTESNSSIAFINHPTSPYFMISVFGTNTDEVDGIYTIVWDQAYNCLDIGNEMYVFDPEAWDANEAPEDDSSLIDNSPIIDEKTGSNSRETITAILLTLLLAVIVASFLGAPISEFFDGLTKLIGR